MKRNANPKPVMIIGMMMSVVELTSVMWLKPYDPKTKKTMPVPTKMAGGTLL